MSQMAEKLKRCRISGIDVPFIANVEFDCYLLTVIPTKKNMQKYELAYKFGTLAYGEMCHKVNDATWIVEGSRETSAVIEIENTTGETIAADKIGIGEYTINTLQPWECITVDGEKKRISSTARDNVFADMGFTHFPALTPGVVKWPMTRPAGVEIRASWRPRW